MLQVTFHHMIANQQKKTSKKLYKQECEMTVIYESFFGSITQSTSQMQVDFFLLRQVTY